MTDYRPIDCDQHSVLELLAMRRAAVTLIGVDGAGAARNINGVVADVFTRDGAEYLRLENDQGAHDVRLDRIRALHDAGGGTIWRQEIGERD